MNNFKPNFRCPKSGREMHFATWKTKIVNGRPHYYANAPGWIPLKHPATGELLEKIEPDEINITSVHTETTISR